MIDTGKIVSAQRAFFDSGRTADVEGRLAVLRKFRDVLVKREKEMIAAAHADMNRPDVETYLMELYMNLEEVEFALSNLKTWAAPKKEKTPMLFFMADSELYPEPYGVTLIISAWNYPFIQLFSPLVGAIAAGNTAVMKAA